MHCIRYGLELSQEEIFAAILRPAKSAKFFYLKNFRLYGMTCTVDQEIFVVKKFSSVAPPTKIKCTKIFLQQILCTWYIFACAHFACSCLFILNAYCSISATRSSVVLFLNSTMPVIPTRWLFITKLVKRCVDLTTPISHDPMFNQRLRAYSESGLAGLFRVR